MNLQQQIYLSDYNKNMNNLSFADGVINFRANEWGKFVMFQYPLQGSLSSPLLVSSLVAFTAPLIVHKTVKIFGGQSLVFLFVKQINLNLDLPDFNKLWWNDSSYSVHYQITKLCVLEIVFCGTKVCGTHEKNSTGLHYTMDFLGNQ